MGHQGSTYSLLLGREPLAGRMMLVISCMLGSSVGAVVSVMPVRSTLPVAVPVDPFGHLGPQGGLFRCFFALERHG